MRINHRVIFVEIALVLNYNRMKMEEQIQSRACVLDETMAVGKFRISYRYHFVFDTIS